MEQIKENILNHAIAIFCQKGIRFTMADVAQDMHISKKTIYRFYTSKEEMLLEMLDYGFEKIRALKTEIIESDLDIREKISKSLIAIPDYYIQMNWEEIPAITEKYPAVAIKLQDQLLMNWDPIISMLNEGVKEGKIRSFSVPIFQTLFTATLEALLKNEMGILNLYSYPDALKQLMDIIMDGIEVKE